MRFALILFPLVIGCSGDEPTEDPDFGSEAYEAENTPAKQPLRASEKAYGSWVISVTDAERRRQTIQLMAIADPPASSEDIKALEMTEDEQTQFQFTQMALKQGEPEMIAEMREVISNLDKATMVVTADTMTMSFGSIKDEARYAVVNETQAGALIKSRREGEPETTYDLSFPTTDTMKLVNVTEPNDVMTFTRVK